MLTPPNSLGRRGGLGGGRWSPRGRQRARSGRTLEAVVWSLISGVKGPCVGVVVVRAGDDVAADTERGSRSRCFGEDETTELGRWSMEC